MLRVHRLMPTLVGVVAATGALYLARDLLIPIILSLLLAALFRPVVRALAAARIHPGVSATLIVLVIVGGLGTAGVLLVHPVQAWVRRAPETLSTARTKLERIRRPVQQVSHVVEKIQQEATGDSSRTRSTAAPAGQSTSVVTRVFGTTTTLLGGFLATIVLLFILLATGDLFRRKLAVALPGTGSGGAERLLEEIEGVVGRYLLVTAAINLVQGVLVALVMHLLGMPSPVLWGVLTFALEFLPYLGAAFMIGLLAVTALATFDGLGRIALPPVAYFLITTIQNNVVSPFAYGSRLRLNPVAVLLAVLYWWFLWGVAGAFVAVPVLATIKILADRSRQGARLGEILGA
jgi:predicted PurR-regulated permease PerM